MRVDGRDAAVAEAPSGSPRANLVPFHRDRLRPGARADDDAAVAKIFALKGRPTGPLIVHVADRTEASASA
jgi:L-threonylcarbamoyladenylate synthase